MTTVYNPPIPYTGMLSTPFQPGTRLEFNGTVGNDPDGITINLKSTSGNIALHFNVRMGGLFGKYIVINSMVNGEWGSEVKPDDCPFKRNQFFNVNITHEPNGYRIAVGGNELAFFGHRSAPFEVCMVEVVGDLQLNSFIEHPVGGSAGGSLGGWGGQAGFGGQPY